MRHAVPHRNSARFEVVLFVIGILGVFAILGLAALAHDDGMTTCQLTHSFDVCHASLF